MKKFLLVLLVLCCCYLIVVWAEWLPLPTPAGKKAVAAMTAPAPDIPDAENAFDDFWLFPYDIPSSEKAKVMAADIAKFAKSDAAAGYVSSAEGKYRKFEDKQNLLCKVKSENCLEKVRANLDGYREFFSKNAGMADRAVAMTRFTQSRSRFEPRMSTPLANYGQPGNWQGSLAAYWFATGKQAEAIDLACRSAGSARSMAIHSQGLIDQMVGQALYANVSRQLAILLSETPGDSVVPESCAKAYAPVELGDFPLCESMKMEYRMVANTMADIENGTNQLEGDLTFNRLTLLWFNQRATLEVAAVSLAGQCSKDAEILAAADKLYDGQIYGMSAMEAGFNPVGGILTRIASPSFKDYTMRMQNLSRVQQAMQIVLRQRKTAEGAIDIHSQASEAIKIDEQANTLEVQLYKTAYQSEPMILPLARKAAAN